MNKEVRPGVGQPDIFKSLADGSAARAANINNYRHETLKKGAIHSSSEVKIRPLEPRKKRLPRKLVAYGSVAVSLLAAACGNPTEAQVGQVENPFPTPAATSTSEIKKLPNVGEGVLAPTPATTETAQPSPTAEKPKATSTAAAQVEKTPVEKIPGVIDSLVASINTLPKSLDPTRTQEAFEADKKNFQIVAQKAKGALARKDTEAAREELANLKAGIRELGDPLAGKFIPQEIRDKYDPQGLILKRTDRVDPAMLDKYLTVVELELALAGK